MLFRSIIIIIIIIIIIVIIIIIIRTYRFAERIQSPVCRWATSHYAKSWQTSFAKEFSRTFGGKIAWTTQGMNSSSYTCDGVEGSAQHQIDLVSAELHKNKKTNEGEAGKCVANKWRRPWLQFGVL